MSIEHDIRAAKTPLDALIILARAIDVINTALDRAAANPWADWSTPMTQTHEQFMAEPELLLPDPQQQAQNDQAITATQQQLAAATDPEEIAALEARLRLLRDTGQSLDLNVPAGRRVGISSDGTTGTVELPAVSEERKDARRAWAGDVSLYQYLPMTSHEAQEAFAAGGPMWLYLGNRDAVMQLPFAARQWLVEDIMLDSQAQAQEVGRDILKSEDSVDHTVTLEAINGS